MRLRVALIAGASLLLTVAYAQALDAVRRLSGPTVSGTITKMSATEVTVEKKVGGAENVPVADIDEVSYDNEPTQLKSARRDAENGAYENALAAIEKIDGAAVARAEIQADIQFYKAMCQAKLALAGGDIAAAGKSMVDFVTKHPSNYHWLEANELVGDLLVASGKFDAARQYYGQLEKSPFPDYKAKAGVALGRSLMVENKFPEALKQFEAVLALPPGKGAAAEAQRLAATLGKAACLAQSGKPDEGIKLVDEVIAGADAENASIMAQAYVTLGNCYLKKPEAKKQALLAFLHVDVLYPSQAQAHAEALKQLAILWNEMNKPERANEVMQTLKDRYAGGAK
ncbi:MAG TPA: hypothetical protein VG713_01525 [Pirellulales bacterium]|nr:hypothetical protein [Pirellulales bacterium]